MDPVANTRKRHVNKKENKENTLPTQGRKSFIKRDEPKVAPFQLKSKGKLDTLTKNGAFKAKTKQVDMGSNSSVALTKVQLDRNEKKEAAAAAAAPNVKITASAVAKAPAATSFKSAPGLYKGKIVQSKIGSIWKSSASLNEVAPKAESQRTGNGTKRRSKSFSDLPKCGTQKPISRPAPSRTAVSIRPPVRAVPATLTRTVSQDSTVGTTKAGGIQSSKQKITTDKVNKPSVSSTLSQYRLTMETNEQRRAKLAEWLASKGKTLKRPAMTTKVSAKPKVDQELQATTECKLKTEHVKEHKPDSAAAAQCADAKEADPTAHSGTPALMDTTLELLENSDDGVDNVVLNLCKDFEAMETPSRGNDDLAQETDEHDDCEIKEPKTEAKQEPELSKTLKGFEGSQAVKQEETDKDEEEAESDNKGLSTAHVENASVVKYSVKTTPYLQSVKKTIEGEGSTNPSRRKSNIKDLKFLTPVRRSCRIQTKSSQLPPMLVDHDPCVSSLAELVKLDDDPNAYIYRRNSALLEALPDQPEL